MKELAWMMWDDVRCRNWNKGIDMNEVKRMTWNEWIEMKQLIRMNWAEWMKWLTWHEWIDMKKWKQNPSVFCDFHVKSSSRYSLVDILSTSSSKSGKQPTVFDNFCVINYLMTMWSTDEMTLSLQSRAHFVDLMVDLIFQKVVRSRQFFLRFLCEIELSLQSRAHFVDHFSDRGAQPRKQTPSSRDHGQPLYPKKTRVLRPRVFSAVNSRVPDRSYFPTVWWPCDWHDDVVDMMMWLTWWCDSKLRESFVTRKFPNYTSFDNDEYWIKTGVYYSSLSKDFR